MSICPEGWFRGTGPAWGPYHMAELFQRAKRVSQRMARSLRGAA